MPITVIDGIKTNYEVKGNGPPLLMYSPGGFDASMDKWLNLGIYARIKLLEHLPEKYTCIIFDRRETGLSGGRVECISWDDYVIQGKGLLDHLGYKKAHLLGGCMGVCPVTVFAVKHPDIVLSLILYWPVGGAHFRIRGHNRFNTHLQLIEEKGLAGVVELSKNTREGFGKDPRVGPWAPVIRTDPDFAERYIKLNVEEYKKTIKNMSDTLLDRDTAPGAEPEDLMQLKVPTLIVPGKDIAHSTAAARFLEECIPNSEYWDITPDAQTEANAPKYLLKFLDKINSP